MRQLNPDSSNAPAKPPGTERVNDRCGRPPAGSQLELPGAAAFTESMCNTSRTFPNPALRRAKLLGSQPVVKICGVRSVQDALCAADAGADIIGLIMVPQSPRYVTLSQAKVLVEALSGRASVAGVFSRSPLQCIRSAVATLGLDFVQLHADESPEFCSLVHVPVIKTVLLNRGSLQTLESYASAVELFLIDRPKTESFDRGWFKERDAFLSTWSAEHKYLLAGGLHDGNVAHAVSRFRPFGVDVASGVEQYPGEKDHRKLRRFIRAAKMAAVSRELQASVRNCRCRQPSGCEHCKE